MPHFEQQRHQEPTALQRNREIVLATVPLRSHVNFSRIVRAASCCGLTELFCAGQPKIDRNIARDAADAVKLNIHRTLPPVLDKLKKQGYHLVGLEQTTHSKNLHTYRFPRKTAIIIGNERLGIPPEILEKLDDTIEIPVWGPPASYNVATATTMALYEYCRQYPNG